MPLIQGKSPKAFENNVKTEMNHGKPQDQALAISYAVKRKNAKKKAYGGRMAEGGEVNESAKTERRPMPDERSNDSVMVAHNEAKKALLDADWTGRPTTAQAQKPSRTPLKHPKMVPQRVYSVRLRDEEDDLQRSAKPNEGTQEHPPAHDDEEGPDRQGPKVSDMQDEHSTKRKPYAKGGEVEQSDYRASKNKYEDDLTDLPPSEDEGEQDADSRDEEVPDRQGHAVPDMEDEHTTGRRPYAKGGSIQYKDAMESEDMPNDLNPAHDKHSEDDSSMQPEREEEEEHHNSVAAAIMAKRDRLHKAVDSGAYDEDAAASYAEGGEILSHRSIYSDDSDQADVKRNAEEDANEEDQLSFNALRKENYNESEGLRQMDSPEDSNLKSDDEEMDSHDSNDMVKAIRSRMNMKRQFR